MPVTRRALPALGVALYAGLAGTTAAPARAAATRPAAEEEVEAFALESDPAASSGALAVNDAGQVLLTRFDPSVGDLPFLRETTGAPVPVRVGADYLRQPTLNRRGQVAGWVGDQAVVWDRRGHQTLPAPGSGYRPLTAFNIRGQVLVQVTAPLPGTGQGAKDVHLVDARSATRLAGGFVAPPNAFGHFQGEGVGTLLTDRGQAVVSGFDAAQRWRVFRFDPAGRATELALPVNWPSVQWLELSNITRSGFFAVNVILSDDGLQTATNRSFLWAGGPLREVLVGDRTAWLAAVNDHLTGLAYVRPDPNQAGQNASVHLWSPGRAVRLEGSDYPYLLNERDQAVVGTTAWSRGVSRSLGSLPGGSPNPVALNDAGLVVGASGDPRRATGWHL